jgi:hypothetical protein
VPAVSTTSQRAARQTGRSAASRRKPLRGATEPRVRSCPPYEFTSGPYAVEIYERTGMVLDPWQRDALDDHLAENADGTWLTLESVEECSRQNGKGEIINAIALLHLFVLGTRTIIYSAHEFKTAKETYLKLSTLIRNTPELHAQVAYYHNSNEDTSIGLKTGQRLRFLTRSKDGGRGFTGDAIIFDEAFNIAAAALDALLPTLSSKPNPHVYYFSSAGKTTAESDVLYGLKLQGEAGDLSIVWRSFSADPECDTDDEAAWAQANPAYGIRITARWIRTVERKRMTVAAFRRERLGIWEPRLTAGSVIPGRKWESNGIEPLDPVSPTVAVDFRTGLEQSYAIVAAFGAEFDGRDVDVIDLVDYELGVGEEWDADYVVAATLPILEAHGLDFVVIDDYGDGNALLVKPFSDAGIRVVPLNLDAMRNATTGFIDGNLNGRVLHVIPDDDGGEDGNVLDLAVAGATTVKSSHGRLWSPGRSAADLVPLRAATAAWWVHRNGEDYDADQSFA